MSLQPRRAQYHALQQLHAPTCTHIAGPSPQQHGGQGQNVDALLGLTFMEAALGTERVFQASVRLQCPDCSGSGLSAHSEPLDCIACRGTGQTMRYQNSILGIGFFCTSVLPHFYPFCCSTPTLLL